MLELIWGQDSANCFSFHCLFCHGYEEKHVASAGVLAVGDMANPYGALHMARMAKRLTSNVTLYTNGADDLAEKTREAAKDDDIKVESRIIKRLEKTAEGTEVVMHFEDGETIREGFLVSFLLGNTGDLGFSYSTLTQSIRCTSPRTKPTGRLPDSWH